MEEYILIQYNYRKVRSKSLSKLTFRGWEKKVSPLKGRWRNISKCQGYQIENRRWVLCDQPCWVLNRGQVGRKLKKSLAFCNWFKGFLESPNTMRCTEIALLWVKDSEEVETENKDIVYSDILREEAAAWWERKEEKKRKIGIAWVFIQKRLNSPEDSQICFELGRSSLSPSLKKIWVLYWFARSAITKHNKLGGSNGRNVLSHSSLNSGGKKSRIKVSTWLLPSEGQERNCSMPLP